MEWQNLLLESTKKNVDKIQVKGIYYTKKACC